jgi:ribosomal protein S18 acetylase RimI-like enzyme
MVLNFIDKQQNEEYDRKRGYTEGISVRRPWRRQGVARGLLTRSIKMFQEMGMEETALGVDVENPRGALNLYESVGYKETKRYTTFRKEMDQ